MSSRTTKTPVLPVALPANLHDCQVLTFKQWCALGNFSPRTGRRILKSGKGPAVAKLSDRRYGISVRSHNAWLAAREAS
jgi:hypothetical protein